MKSCKNGNGMCINKQTKGKNLLFYTLVVESCPVEIRPLFENPGHLKPGKNRPGQGEL